MLALALVTVAVLSSVLLMTMTRVALDVQGVRHREDQLQARATAHGAIEVTVRSGLAIAREPAVDDRVVIASDLLGHARMRQRAGAAPDLVELEVDATHGRGRAHAGVTLRVQP